jgi:hypothetical protein
MSLLKSVLQLSEQRVPFAVTLPALVYVTVQPLQSNDETQESLSCVAKFSNPNTYIESSCSKQTALLDFNKTCSPHWLYNIQ